MKIWLTVTLLLAITCCSSKGETKILREVNISSDDAYRQETFSLKNENTEAEELVIEGSYTQSIYPKDNTDFVYRIETTYVADKDGYQVKYTLMREPSRQVVLQLNPSTLKSLAG